MGRAAEEAGKTIVVYYEAGCFGYVLYRNLVKMGIECLVVAPRKWDQGVKTDVRDARELCSNLDRYLSGSRKALTVVHVPSPKEEQRRSFSRQRESLSEDFQHIQNMGTSHKRYYGQYVPADWWKPRAFASAKSLPSMRSRSNVPSFSSPSLWSNSRLKSLDPSAHPRHILSKAISEEALFNLYEDQDADGQVTLLEYISGTDPKDAGSVSSPVVIDVDPEGNTVEIVYYRAKGGTELIPGHYRLDKLDFLLQHYAGSEWEKPALQIETISVLSGDQAGQERVILRLTYPERLPPSALFRLQARPAPSPSSD